MIEKLNGIKRIYSSYFHEFLLQLEVGKNEKMFSLFGLFEKTKANFELKKNSIQDYGLSDDKIFYFLELYFFEKNLDLFKNYSINEDGSTDINALSFDNIENLFMKINDYLFKILDESKCFVVIEDGTSQKLISWNESKTNFSKYFKDVDECLYKEKSNIFQREQFTLDSNKKVCIYYEKTFNWKMRPKEYKDLILLFCNLTKNLYSYHFHQLLNIDSNDIYGIGWNNKNFAIDRDYFVKHNALRIFPYSEQKEINILHISDLHLIKTDKIESFADKFLEEFYKTKCFNITNGKDEKTFDKIDIIVITGDTINAGHSTEEILNNYLFAFGEIQIIGKVLLGNLWLKRIIVIPGNHDYGMINDLKIKIKDRAFGGSHAQSSNDEFKKFVLFHFVFDNKSLNKTIFKIENQKKSLDTIKIKYEPNKSLYFYPFNTSCNANTKVSNKVSLYLDPSFKFAKEDFIFLLMHHTPLFEINYYRDLFGKDYYDYSSFIFGYESFEFKEIIKAINTNSMENVIELYNKHNVDIYKRLKDDIEVKEKKILGKIKEKNEALINELKKNSQGKSSILNCFKESVEDQNKYNEMFQTIIKSITSCDDDIKTSCLVMGGHFHHQRYKKYENYQILEVGKTFLKNEETEKEKLYFAILNIDTKNVSMKMFSSVPMEKISTNIESTEFAELCKK